MTKINLLIDKQTAIKIGKFLTGPDAFDQTWAPNEKILVENSVVESLNNPNHQYWYVEGEGRIDFYKEF